MTPTRACTDVSGLTPRARAIWAATAIAGSVAAVVATLIAATAKAAGVDFEVDGRPIPTLGFAQLTFAAAVIGGLLAVGLAARARRPRGTFLAVTGTLTALSLIPDLTFGFDPASALVLMATHVVAAVIVVPPIARRLRR